MTTCNKNGECLQQCYCTCYNKQTYIYNEICNCGQREHEGYLPSNCCYTQECRNYKFCKQKRPKWLLNINNNLCSNCAFKLGPHKITELMDECPVCLEKKNLIILDCNHSICNECWYKTTIKINKPICPLCRSMNDWTIKINHLTSIKI